MPRSASVDGSSVAGAGLATAIGRPTTTPTIITQARTTRDPSIRLERDEQRVAAAHNAAAPRPPMMAVTAAVWRVGRHSAVPGPPADL